MMKKYLILYTVVLLSVCLALPGQAQIDMKKLGQSTMNFLKVGISARAASMGNAYTSIGEGAEALFYNPAGMVKNDYNSSAFVSMTQWIADINYIAAAATHRLGAWGTFGLSFVNVDYGDVYGTQVLSASDPQGYIDIGLLDNVGAYAFGVHYGRQISQKFSMGGSIQYVGQQLGQTEMTTGSWTDNTADKLAFNFGMLFYPGFRSFRFAMAMRNFSSSVEYEEVTTELPMNFMVGTAMDVLDVFNPQHSDNTQFLVTAEFEHPNNYTERLNLGGEFVLMQMIALRAGYRFNHDLAGLSAGIGFMPSFGAGKLVLNYSYSTMEFLDDVNRFSLSVAF